MKPYFTTIKVDTWETARKIQLCMSKATNWAFRGQSNDQWDLQTNFERHVSNFQTFHRKFDKDYFDKENFIIEQFKQRAHFYINSLPGNENLIEWLSLLQHYGCPTRLLDFSYSFYVAAFFAMEESTSNCAIWAINLESIDNATEEFGGLIENFNFYDKDEYFDTLKFSNYVLNNHVSDNLVSYATPFRMHERLSIQQGLFVFPCNLTNSFVDNFISTFNQDHTMDKPSYYQINLSDKIDYSIFNKWPLVKIIIPHDCHNSALLDLKSMNISAATLFPGLDGFARSLKLYYRGSEFDGEFQRALLTML